MVREVALELLSEAADLGPILVGPIPWQIDPILGERHNIAVVDVLSAHPDLLVIQNRDSTGRVEIPLWLYANDAGGIWR
jgi:hypothetical protein